MLNRENKRDQIVPHDCCCCPHPLPEEADETGVNRREFMTLAGTLAAAGAVLTPAIGLAVGGAKDRPRQQPIHLPLKVQPVFHCNVDDRKEATSWRYSGAIHSEAEIRDEEAVIRRELAELAASVDFPMEILPLATVRDAEQAAAVIKRDYDAMLIYGARRDAAVVEVLAAKDKWNLMFVRHRSGPLYYMYVGVHAHVLRKTGDEFAAKGLDLSDVVVDDYAELRWRLRALAGLKNTLGKRVVVIGAPSGWSAVVSGAPERAESTWKMDLRVVSYEEVEERIKKAQANTILVNDCRAAAEKYLKDGSVTLETKREFVDKAFLLTEVFRDLLDEAQTDAITIRGCMRTIMPISGTTACMPLSILNDEGYLAHCESDFVCIPAGTLLREISGLPFFFCNPSMPHQGVVTALHCTAPRKMDGKRAEPVRIVTHYESDFGAAPHVDMKKGQKITVIDADFHGRRWLGFRGEIIDTPFFPVCRTQLDIRMFGDWNRITEEIRGWHWMIAYGDHLREVGYALKKTGIDWLAIT